MSETAENILAELEKLGTAQNRKIYTRHGVGGEFFGVSYANLEKLAKRLKKSERRSEIGAKLWETGNHDAVVLGTKIIDPGTVTKKQAQTWVRGVSNSLQTHGLAELISHTPLAPALADEWTAASSSRSLWKVVTGWALIGAMLKNSKHHVDVPETWYRGHLKTIQSTIQDSPNDIKDTMNGTLIAIGGHTAGLRKSAITAAKKIGKVEVDHGETSCKTPDAVAYIEKIWARREERAGK